MAPSVPGRAWLLAALPAAAVLAIDPAGLSPFGPLKWLLIPSLLLAGSAVLASSGLARRPVARNPAVAMAAFLAWVGLAAAVGADGLYAWTGTPERHFGAFTWGLCGLAFVVGQWLEPVAARRVITVAMVTAGVAGAWALAEAAGWQPLDLAGAGVRPVATLGSSAYLGAAMALLAPVAVGVAVDRASRPLARRAALLAAAAAALALVASGARAAWVGAIVAGLATAWCRRQGPGGGSRGAPGHDRRRLALAGTAGVALVVAVAVATGVTGRLTGVADETGGGARGRLDEWRVAARVVADHPLTGVGPEGYRIVFGGAVDDDYEMAHGRDPLPDRAHSAPLDVAVTTGLPGLAAYAVLVGLVGRLVLRSLRRSPAALAGVAAGLVAYTTQSLLLFPVAELEPVAWLLAGLVVARSLTAGEAATLAVPRIAPVVAGALAALALVAGVLDVAADRVARSTL
ncbi:MAG: O-antigen ligase family protein, partial [Acidimicrobiales bacterium]